jgi:hypothetical protein
LEVPEKHEPPERSEAAAGVRNVSAGHSPGEDVTSLESDEQGKTAPIDLPPPATLPAVSSPPSATSHPLADTDEFSTPRAAITAEQVVARPASPQQQEVLFVPLAVNIGDGFKFGCGFFLAAVLAMLVGFVLVAALFVFTSLFGLNLPISR